MVEVIFKGNRTVDTMEGIELLVKLRREQEEAEQQRERHEAATKTRTELMFKAAEYALDHGGTSTDALHQAALTIDEENTRFWANYEQRKQENEQYGKRSQAPGGDKGRLRKVIHLVKDRLWKAVG